MNNIVISKFNNLYIKLDVGCGYRAIVLGLKYHQLEMELVKKDMPEKILYYDMNGHLMERDNPEYISPEARTYYKEEWDRMKGRTGGFDYQIGWAKKLCEYSGFDYNIPFNSAMYDKMQEYLSDQANFQLIVINSKNIHKLLYPGKENPKKIYIEYIHPNKKDEPGHYNYISNIRGYCETKYYCYQCYTAHNTPQHLCENACLQCGNRPKCDMTDPMDCIFCRKRFNNKVII